MRWQLKAMIARICAQLPYGDTIYKFGQRHVGRLRSDPKSRLLAQVEMLQWLRTVGVSVVGKTLVEVGTGHVPVLPIGFYIAGADQTVTVDAHRRLDWSMTQESLRWIEHNRHELVRLYTEDIVPKEIRDERFAKLVELSSDPKAFLRLARIRYLSPGDASKTYLGAGSVDCHFSVTVLEHIPEDILTNILPRGQTYFETGWLRFAFCRSKRSLPASGFFYLAN